MKHKHHDKIVAKAANTGLVQLIKMDGEWESAGLSDKFISFSEEYDYFLCLPQHKDACLHWLNGGDVQVRDFVTSTFVDIGWDREWSIDDCGFMVEDWVFRIKPKKEKRWIAVNSDGYVMPVHCGNIESARQHASHIDSRLTENVQFIEIEVEV